MGMLLNGGEAGTPLTGEPSKERGFPTWPSGQIQPSHVAIDARTRQRDGDQLTPLILHAHITRSHGSEFFRLAGQQRGCVRRPATGFYSRVGE
jgi:hypothetical protein